MDRFLGGLLMVTNASAAALKVGMGRRIYSSFQLRQKRYIKRDHRHVADRAVFLPERRHAGMHQGSLQSAR